MEAWQGTVGRFRPVEQNENGLKLLHFCVLNGLGMTNTFFQHQPCHQHTWDHPPKSSHAGHTLDHVLHGKPEVQVLHPGYQGLPSCSLTTIYIVQSNLDYPNQPGPRKNVRIMEGSDNGGYE